MAKNKATRSRRSRPRSSSSSTSKKADGETVVSVRSDSTKKRPREKAQTTPAKTRAAKIDAVKPKKPPTAFFFYLEDFRKEYQEQNPDVKSMRNIGKACGEKWKTMTYEEKVHYYDIATEKRAEFDAAMADFIKRKESGEFDEDDSEFEDESDFDV